MQISLQPIHLDTRNSDGQAFLVLREGQLLAVASRLSHHHEDLAGSLYIEAVFGDRDEQAGAVFRSQEELACWAERIDQADSESAPVAVSWSS